MRCSALGQKYCWDSISFKYSGNKSEIEINYIASLLCVEKAIEVCYQQVKIQQDSIKFN